MPKKLSVPEDSHVKLGLEIAYKANEAHSNYLAYLAMTGDIRDDKREAERMSNTPYIFAARVEAESRRGNIAVHDTEFVTAAHIARNEAFAQFTALSLAAGELIGRETVAFDNSRLFEKK